MLEVWSVSRLESRLDLVFHAMAFTLDDGGFGVMKQAIQKGRGKGTVVVEDSWPMLVGTV